MSAKDPLRHPKPRSEIEDIYDGTALFSNQGAQSRRVAALRRAETFRPPSDARARDLQLLSELSSGALFSGLFYGIILSESIGRGEWI